MAKQELDEKLEFEKAVGLKGGFKSAAVSLLKFILSIILLPLVVGLTISFCQQLTKENTYILNNFCLGGISYLVLHLFIYEPRGLYDFGQLIIGRLFGFFVPLRNLLYCCLPLYTSIIFVFYFIFKVVFGYDNIIGYFIFLISFSSIMHLVLTADYLKKDSLDALRGGYFLSLFLVFIFEIILIAGFFEFMLSGFSYINFIKVGFNFFVNTLLLCWNQLFVFS